MSHLDSPYRLPRTVLPRRYDVSLVPDLAGASFTGTVRITADVVVAAEQIVLNAIELQIHSVVVNGAAATWTLDDTYERMVIAAPVAAGAVTIDIAFTGILNDKLRGFYRSTFTDADGVEQVIATTQMQATDCRRAFPCFDEPDFKAVFAIDLTFDPSLMAVSNAPEVRRESVADGRVRAWFGDTMLMSTYLVAFAVGPLEATDPVMVGDIPVRVVHVRGKGHLAQFGLDAGAKCLAWFQDYYGIPYPCEKMDMLALPDFAAGAMENPGCITYREVLLLVDPATSTQVEQEHVADVIAHEIAHMWFGDLVTMKWWNGIWLNEAFATFMGVSACDAYAPHWKRWTSFGLERSAAFDVDSLHSTRTIEFPVESPADADGMFDLLTYEKGGSILRMLEQFLGRERFRAGVNHYLRTHAHGNTETNDLWDALEHVVSTDGGDNVPVRRLMDSWIWQQGYPLVSARIDGNDLVLSQRRFTYDDTPDSTVWLVPVHLRIGGTDSKVLLESAETRIALADPSATVVVNAGGNGFFRVEYSADLLSRLTGPTLSQLEILDRYNLVDDAWQSVLRGETTPDQWRTFVSQFSGVRDLAVWQVIAAGLKGISRIVSGAAETAHREYVRTLVGPAMADLGWDPVADEDDLTAKLRGLIVGLLAVAGNDTDAQRRCRSILFENTVRDPELVAAATTVVAATGDAQDHDWFIARFRDAATPQDRIRMLYALAEFDSADLMQRTCAFATGGEVKSQDAPFLLNRCIANRNHGHIAWDAVRAHWDAANRDYPGNTIVRMVATVSTLNTPELRADVLAFFAEHPIPQGAKTLEQTLERQGVNVALRTRFGTSD